jgi:hypothetical protein
MILPKILGRAQMDQGASKIFALKVLAPFAGRTRMDQKELD